MDQWLWPNVRRVCVVGVLPAVQTQRALLEQQRWRISGLVAISNDGLDVPPGLSASSFGPTW